MMPAPDIPLYQQIAPVYARAWDVFRANLSGFALLAAVVTGLGFVLDFSAGATAVVWIGIALIAHRAILLGQGIGSWGATDTAQAPRYGMFILAFVGLGLVVVVATLASMALFHSVLPGGGFSLAMLPAILVHGVVMARYGIVLPAFAVGDPRSSTEIMALGQGQTGRTFLRLACGSFMMTVLLVVALLVLAALLSGLVGPTVPVLAVVGFLGWMGGTFSTILAATALSLGYLEGLGRAAPLDGAPES